MEHLEASSAIFCTAPNQAHHYYQSSTIRTFFDQRPPPTSGLDINYYLNKAFPHVARMSASTRPRSATPNGPQLLAAILSCTPLLANAAAGNYAYFTDRDSGGGVSTDMQNIMRGYKDCLFLIVLSLGML